MAIRITLRSVSHTYPDDLDVLLANPAGQGVRLVDDRCGSGTTPLTGQTFVFEDAAPPLELPDEGPCTSGTYRPSFLPGGNSLPAPAPQGPYLPTLLSLKSPINGDWRLWVADDATNDAGSVAGGWSLELLPAVSCLGKGVADLEDAGTAGNDVLKGLGVAVGKNDSDSMHGFAGRDVIRGGPGPDRICGGPGNDTLIGGAGNDQLFGGGGKDKLKAGGGGEDRCKGGGGRDAAKACEKEIGI